MGKLETAEWNSASEAEKVSQVRVPPRGSKVPISNPRPQRRLPRDNRAYFHLLRPP